MASPKNIPEETGRKVAVISRFHAVGLSDPGRRRENNEDRWHADPERGIYFVVDGVGGQAAGEKAAETACDVLRARLERVTGSVQVRIREAITLANNEIHRLAQTHDDWHGMACVLTVAVVEDNEVYIGQVGDSRLYLIQPGEITKLTHDHSPVGEREDRGEIDEVSAMRHPRRNEVYRDVGTTQHSPDDPGFIEITSAPLPSDSVLLLCSDGLSDLVTSKQILSIVEANAGDAETSAAALIAAANDSGGKDNITVVLVEGPRFAPGVRRRNSSPRTTVPLVLPRSNPLLSRWAFLVYGVLTTVLAAAVLKPHWIADPVGQTIFGLGAVRAPRTWRVANDINSAINAALPGDTVLVAPGTYNEQLRLRDGVNVVSEKPMQAILRSTGVAVSGEDIKAGRLEGFRIQPDDSLSLLTGIQLTNCAAEIVDNYISGTVTAGVDLTNSPGTVIRANRILPKSHTAIMVGGEGSGPRIVGNELSAEGQAAVVVNGTARPVVTGNVIRATEILFPSAQSDLNELQRENVVLSSQNPPSDTRPISGSPAGKKNAPPRVR